MKIKNQFKFLIVLGCISMLNVISANSNDLNTDDDLMYIAILNGLENSYIQDVYDYAFIKCSINQGKEKLSEIMYWPTYQVTYKEFQYDSINFRESIKKFYNSKINIVKYLLKFHDDTTFCKMLFGWSEIFSLNYSGINKYWYLMRKNYSSIILILNYFLNENKNDIKIYTIPEGKTTELYNKIENIYTDNGKNFVKIKENIKKEFSDYHFLKH